MFILGFFIPLIIIVISYMALYFKLKTNEIFLAYSKKDSKKMLKNRNLKETEDAIEEDEDFTSTLKNNYDLNTSNQKRTCEKLDGMLQSREVKLAKMIFIMIFFFGIAWTPYSFISLYAQYGMHAKKYVTPISTSIAVLIAKTSSFYNPIVYTLSNRECLHFFMNFVSRKNLKNLN